MFQTPATMQSTVATVLAAALLGVVLTSPLAQESVQVVDLSDLAGPASDIDKRAVDTSNCYTLSHGTLRNGETLQYSRCINYVCRNGNLVLNKEGCDYVGQCWRVNQYFRYKCKSFLCSVAITGSSRFYNVQASGEQLCEDYYGNCHRQGVRYTSLQNGMLRNNCYCQVYGRATVTHTTCHY